MRATVPVWCTEESGLSFHHVGPGLQLQKSGWVGSAAT